MQKRILDFVSGLRRAGNRVSSSELMDALVAAVEVGLEDRETFKSALAAALVKDARDRPTFDRLFDRYFRGGATSGEGSSSGFEREAPGRVHPIEARARVESAGEVGQTPDAWGSGPGPFGRPAAAGRHGTASRAGRRGRGAHRERHALSRETLLGKPLSELAPDELADMRELVARLARRIKDALALRRREEWRGRLDTRRTVRRNLRYAGIRMEVVLKRRRRDRPKLITVCDVSDSVRNASRFMLQLVWSLQQCFSRVRSFVFVSEIVEVTDVLDRLPVDRGIEWALSGADVDYHCQSDFGHAFSRFVDGQLDTLDRRTTVLVLGDACNNFRDPQPWTLDLIRERVKGIIWLNPEPASGWGLGDSVMPVYARSCDLVRECQTVRQLGEVVEGLVQSWWRR